MKDFKWIYLGMMVLLCVTFDGIVRGPMGKIERQLNDILWTKRESLRVHKEVLRDIRGFYSRIYFVEQRLDELEKK